MTIYWILLAIPALIGLAYSFEEYPGWVSLGHRAMLFAFAVFYAIVAMLRFEVGGDWGAYAGMYEDIRMSSLSASLTITDPAFALLLWLSAQLALNVYVANGIAALLLALGMVRLAATTRNPWAAVMISVPYLLIVVGMGYVRQGAAIGLVLLAVVALGRGRGVQTMINLALALAFHTTSIIVWPLFAAVMARRNKVQVAAITVFGTIGFLALVSSRLGKFEAGYVDETYDSSGALVRLLMGLVPSLLLLARYRSFTATGPTRTLWLYVALGNVAMFIALGLVSSSTAVDRLALYFAPIQLVVFGEMAALVGSSRQTRILLRFALIAVAVAVQMVWLLYATHASYWVPYKTILSDL